MERTAILFAVLAVVIAIPAVVIAAIQAFATVPKRSPWSRSVKVALWLTAAAIVGSFAWFFQEPSRLAFGLACAAWALISTAIAFEAYGFGRAKEAERAAAGQAAATAASDAQAAVAEQERVAKEARDWPADVALRVFLAAPVESSDALVLSRGNRADLHLRILLVNAAPFPIAVLRHRIRWAATARGARVGGDPIDYSEMRVEVPAHSSVSHALVLRGEVDAESKLGPGATTIAFAEADFVVRARRERPPWDQAEQTVRLADPTTTFVRVS